MSTWKLDLNRSQISDCLKCSLTRGRIQILWIILTGKSSYLLSNLISFKKDTIENARSLLGRPLNRHNPLLDKRNGHLPLGTLSYPPRLGNLRLLTPLLRLSYDSLISSSRNLPRDLYTDYHTMPYRSSTGLIMGCSHI